MRKFMVVGGDDLKVGDIVKLKNIDTYDSIWLNDEMNLDIGDALGKKWVVVKVYSDYVRVKDPDTKKEMNLDFIKVDKI